MLNLAETVSILFERTQSSLTTKVFSKLINKEISHRLSLVSIASSVSLKGIIYTTSLQITSLQSSDCAIQSVEAVYSFPFTECAGY